VADSYFIRTYGCQMNEHDSERIAGLLEADGLTPADSLDHADVIVLNTCCIRENADNKFYGHLGQLKALKDQRPEVQIAVAGCLAQKDQERIQERAGHVDVVFGTHNVHRAAELLDQARRDGPVIEILTEAARADADAFPSALPVRRESAISAWVTIQIGCDNSCAFCIVPSVRGVEMSRPFRDIVDDATFSMIRQYVIIGLPGVYQNVSFTINTFYSGVITNNIQPAIGIKGGWTPAARVTGCFAAENILGEKWIAGSYFTLKEAPSGDDAANLLLLGGLGLILGGIITATQYH